MVEKRIVWPEYGRDTAGFDRCMVVEGSSFGGGSFGMVIRCGRL